MRNKKEESESIRSKIDEYISDIEKPFSFEDVYRHLIDNGFSYSITSVRIYVLSLRDKGILSGFMEGPKFMFIKF